MLRRIPLALTALLMGACGAQPPDPAGPAGAMPKPTEAVSPASQLSAPADPGSTPPLPPVPTAPPVTGTLPIIEVLPPTTTTAPQVPTSAPPPTSNTPPPATECGIIRVNDVAFDTNLTSITAAAGAALATELARLAPGATVAVIGHADRRPPAPPLTNDELSNLRAHSVADVARSAGVDVQLVEGRGDREPVDPGDTEEAWARNRRVEIHVLCPAENL